MEFAWVFGAGEHHFAAHKHEDLDFRLLETVDQRRVQLRLILHTHATLLADHTHTCIVHCVCVSYRAAVVVSERKLFDEHAEAELAGADDVLDLEVDEVHARVVHFLDDLREFARGAFDRVFGLGACAHEFPIRKKHRRGFWVSKFHHEAVLLGHELGFFVGFGEQVGQIEAHAKIRRAHKVPIAQIHKRIDT